MEMGDGGLETYHADQSQEQPTTKKNQKRYEKASGSWWWSMSVLYTGLRKGTSCVTVTEVLEGEDTG